MSSSTSPSSSLPTGLAPVAGLPPAAHAVLHRELFHIHSSLHLILLILRGPWDTVTPDLADTVTCPRLSATLRALETSIEQIKRTTCTTLVYTDQLLGALRLLHPLQRRPPPLPHQSLPLPCLDSSSLHPLPHCLHRRLHRRLPRTYLFLSLLTPFLPLRHRRGGHALAHALALDLPRDDLDSSFQILDLRRVSARKVAFQMPLCVPYFSF